jgi:hypothetical protein
MIADMLNKNLNVMKYISVLTIVIISFSLLLPVAAVQKTYDTGKTASLVTLDVCHHSDGGATIVLDMPYLCESSLVDFHIGDRCVKRPLSDMFKRLLLATPIERPPQA